MPEGNTTRFIAALSLITKEKGKKYELTEERINEVHYTRATQNTDES